MSTSKKPTLKCDVCQQVFLILDENGELNLITERKGVGWSSETKNVCASCRARREKTESTRRGWCS